MKIRLVMDIDIEDGFRAMVDGVTLPNYLVKFNRAGGMWEIYYPHFDVKATGLPMQESWYVYGSVIEEIEWYANTTQEMRDRDHATAIVLEKVNGDPEKLIEYARMELLAVRHAAGMLMNQFGEKDARFDAFASIKATGENASDELTDLKQAIRDGVI